jgi:hypothetical protein
MLVKWAVKQVRYFYAPEQTREFQVPFAAACHRFVGLFCGHAFQKDFIEKPHGNLDAREWPHSRWPLRDSVVKAHVLHRRVVGVIGHHYTSDITSDVDFHEADTRREFFLARCQAFHRELSKFFVGCPWFAEHTVEAVGGRHFRVLVRKMHLSEARKLALEFLRRLDRKYSALAALESFAKIEVYPVPKGGGAGTGLRLPLCRGRVTVTDRHLAGSPEQNCIDLIGWIAGGRWHNLPLEKVMAFLAAHTPEHEGHARPRERRQRRTGGGGMGSVGPFRGCYYRKLIDFWSECRAPAPDTIGIWLCGTLRALKAEGRGLKEALGWVEERLLSLSDTSFSDRLTGDSGEPMRVTRLSAAAIWDGNGYQPRVEESDRKLAAAVAFLQRQGRLPPPPGDLGQPGVVVAPPGRSVGVRRLHVHLRPAEAPQGTPAPGPLCRRRGDDLRGRPAHRPVRPQVPHPGTGRGVLAVPLRRPRRPLASKQESPGPDGVVPARVPGGGRPQEVARAAQGLQPGPPVRPGRPAGRVVLPRLPEGDGGRGGSCFASVGTGTCLRGG